MAYRCTLRTYNGPCFGSVLQERTANLWFWQRGFEAGDLADLYEYLSDAEVVAYEPYPPLTEKQCEEYLEQMMHSEDFGAVCLQHGEKQIGQVYLAEKEQNAWELGYALIKITSTGAMLPKQ